jgi:hypothetical protein
MLRQWSCAMMNYFLFYYTYAEAIDLCNDEFIPVLLHCWWSNLASTP